MLETSIVSQAEQTRERLLTSLTYYPILSVTLFRKALDVGGTDVQAHIDDLLLDKKLHVILPTPGANTAFRYCLPEHVERLSPFLKQQYVRQRHSTIEQTVREKIKQRFHWFPVMIPLLLGAALQSTGSLYSDLLQEMVDEGILAQKTSSDGRRGERYYLRSYEALLQPWLEHDTMNR